MDAVKRAMQLAVTPMKDVPPLAVALARHMGRQIGLSGEVYITAYACYAQVIENLPCDDDLYICQEQEKDFLEKYRNHAFTWTELADGKIRLSEEPA